jgi:hypothetical protein
MQYGTLDGGTLYFHFGLNTTAGEGSDATGTPTFDVRLCGAAANAAPVLSGNCDLLSHANFPPGAYEIAVAPSTANGFVTGNTYAVFCEAVVSSVNPTGYVGTFTLAPVRTDVAAAPSAASIASQVRTELTVELDRIDVDVSSRLAGASYTAPDNATIGTTATAVNAIGVIVTAIQAIFSGITLLGNWLRVMARSDVGTAGMTTAQGEINTSGGTYDRTTDALEAPVSVDVDEAAIADEVVAAIQAIPGFTVEVVSPVDDTGEIQVTQGDAYLEANSRNISITLTGSLPSLASACKFRVFFGGTVTEYDGTVEVVTPTNYKLKCDLTGVQTAAMPVGTFQYEVEVTYASTTNKWTPSTGKFIVKGQIG